MWNCAPILTFPLICRLNDVFRLFVNSLWVWHLTTVDKGSDWCVVIEPHYVTCETSIWTWLGKTQKLQDFSDIDAAKNKSLQSGRGTGDNNSLWVWKRVCVFVTHLQDASSIHSICAGGYSLKYPKMSCVLMSSTPVMWIASRRSREIAWYHRKKRNYRYKKMTHETTAGLKKYSTIFYLSSSFPYPEEQCADCCSPPHRNGNVSLASLSVQWPPKKIQMYNLSTNHFLLFTCHSLPHFRSLWGCLWVSRNI